MKKIFLTLVVAAFAVCAQAQVYVGGGIGFGVASYDSGHDDDDAIVYKFSPEIGYTFDKNFAAGIALGWEGASEGGQKAFSINPYVRYTFARFNAVSVFADGTVGYEHKYGGYEHTDGFQVGIKPGVAVSLNDKLSFVAHVGFLGFITEKDVDTKAKQSFYGFDVDGANLSFGLYYNF